MNAANDKSFLITTIIKSILLIAGFWFATANDVIRFITLGYVIFTLIGTTVLLFKTTNLFRDIYCDDFTDKMNQICIWIMMGINASLTIGLIFNNPVLKAIGLIAIIGDLIASIIRLITVIREERMWKNVMATIYDAIEAEDTEE